MNIPVPYGLIAIFIALSFFYYVSQKNRIRKEDRRERLQERQEELLNVLRKKAIKEQDVQVSDATKAEE